MITCPICETEGEPLYTGLMDRMLDTPGQWNFWRCPAASCGLIWLHPAPSADLLTQAYVGYYTKRPFSSSLRGSFVRDTIASGYLAVRFGYRSGLPWCKRWAGWAAYLHHGERQQIEASVMYLHASRRGTLLDIGFGDGTRLWKMQRLGWEVYGVESDKEAVERARHTLGNRVRHGSFPHLPFDEKSFDAVTLNHVLEHTADPLSVLEEVGRIVRPGGSVVVVTPNSGSHNHRVYGPAYLHLDPPRHMHLFNRGNLKALFEAAGLTVERCWISTRNYISTRYASRQIRHTGRFFWHDQPKLQLRLSGVVLHWWARFLSRFDNEFGDEVILIATTVPSHGMNVSAKKHEGEKRRRLPSEA